MKNNKIDWTIHMIPDVYENSILLHGFTNYHTHGLEKHGLTNLSVIMDDTYDSKTIASLINTVAEMMIDGEEFAIGCTHYIDNAFDFCFEMKETLCFGEPTIRLIVFDKNKLNEEDMKITYMLQNADGMTAYEVHNTNSAYGITINTKKGIIAK